jgi:hypothetical protein
MTRLIASTIIWVALPAATLAQTSPKPNPSSHTRTSQGSAPRAGVRPNDGHGSLANGPSGADLYDAIQVRLDNWNANWKETVQKCKNLGSDNQQDPVLGMQCLTLFLANGDPTNPANAQKYDFTAEITEFKKVECAKAVGVPGFVCDYEIAVSQNNPAFTGSLGKIMEGTSITEARFLYTGDRWIMAP